MIVMAGTRRTWIRLSLPLLGGENPDPLGMMGSGYVWRGHPGSEVACEVVQEEGLRIRLRSVSLGVGFNCASTLMVHLQLKASPERLLEFFGSRLALPRTKQLHAAIITSSLSRDQFLAVKLLRSYAANEDLKYARNLFDEIPHRNIYLWNSMLRAYAACHDLPNVARLFSTMQSSDIKPDGHTHACVMRAFSEKHDVIGLKAIHGRMVLSGLESDYVGCSALISAYWKVGLVDEASLVFDGVGYKDLVMWNVMISGCGHGGVWHKGLEMFRHLRNSNENPDGYSLVGALSCIWDKSLLFVGRSIHGLCLKSGFDSSDHVRSALVSMYMRCDCLDLACHVFRSFQLPDLVTWSAFLCGFAQAGECEEALRLFSEMVHWGVKPDSVLVPSMLSACIPISGLRCGREIHGYALRLGLGSDVSVSCALMDMYIKCGLGQLGLQIFEMMPRTTTAYNILISGLGFHGLASEAFGFFEELLAEGLDPDEATFSALLCACCHSGLVEEAQVLFRRMQDEFRMEAKMEHFVYIIRILGMAGKLHEAHEFIKTMPLQPDCGAWGALLWGCNIHGNLELGRIAANHLFEMEPHRTAYRVILSNTHASMGNWDDANDLRHEMSKEGDVKSPGLSWVC